MPKVSYIDKTFRPSSLDLIITANLIIDDYQRQGFKLTLRQLYYQFVARDLIDNTQRNYKRLGSVINDARLAGHIDWDAIEDRTREVASIPHWDSPSEIINACARQFRIDKWRGQKYRPEVWIEKEALAGVVERVCHDLDISFLSCRGYTSQSEMWASAMRLRDYARSQNQIPVILHFGDHDPSGLDMTRDIRDRLKLFMGGMEVRRLALNMNQIRKFNPPPNPAKTTDSRFAAYRSRFGRESWELDALEPTLLVGLIRKAVLSMRDDRLWKQHVDIENEMRSMLKKASDRWGDVTDMLSK